MMKFNLTKLALTVGLGLGILSQGSLAEAGHGTQGSSLTGQKHQSQLQQSDRGLFLQNTSSTKEKHEQQSEQRDDCGLLHCNSSSLTGHSTEE